MKAALTGAHGTGKTTLSSHMAEKMRQTLKVGHTPEIPRLFIEEIGDNTIFQRGNNSFARQALIIARQIETESSMLSSGLDLLICDRTIVDHWAYTEILFPTEVATLEGQAWKSMVARWVASYDLICRLPIEFAMEVDGVRESDDHFRNDVDEKIVALYREFRRETEIIRGSLSDREVAFEELIRKRLNSEAGAKAPV
jgi:nicotinamide riboside kinase